MTLSEVSAGLAASRPSDTLFHYTSLKALMAIVSSRSLLATDIRYFNDAAELRHPGNLLRTSIAQRLEAGTPHARVLTQFNEWTRERLANGHMLFVVSFTANGNLLSQWRGYCAAGKGVSLGFAADKLLE